MNPSPSPPQEAEQVRHAGRLTPASPRPQTVPSPANIPILELQMDPNYNESLQANGTLSPTSHTPNHFTTTTPNHFTTTTPYLAGSPANHQIAGAHGDGGGFAQSAAYGGSTGAQAQGTSSIHNYSAQQQPSTASTPQALPAPGHGLHSVYSYAHDPAYAAQHAQAQSAPGAHYQTESGAGADVLALLDSLNASANSAPTAQHVASSNPSQSAQLQGNAPALSLAGASHLPPRPPAQDKSTTHPNYKADDDIRSFHPPSHQAPNTQQRGGNGQLQPVSVRMSNYGSTPHGVASPTGPDSARRQREMRSETPDDEDARWPPEVNRRYEEFLDQERKFVTEGQWDQFPMGSRLFIGNLPTEKVTKRDIFHRFYRHGRLAQISIKQAYGFVQFLDIESCRRALDAEQGQAVRGRKMHLEVSKPQKNSTRKPDPSAANARRRSRSPDYTRGGNGPTSRDGRHGNGGPLSPRERDRRFRERDEFRPMRSPSPRSNPRGMRSRDRSRDRYDGRYRSRSRTPPRRRRSPSPRRDYTEDDLDLRRRLPHEVPDIQILVLNEAISRTDFPRYVEDTFRQQGLRCNVLVLSGRFPEPAVVRRQIIEGVLAIVRMDTSGHKKGKIGVQIFDRRSGTNNVQFNEYADLDPTTVALLVNNAKQNQSQPVQPPAAPFYNGAMPPFNQSGPSPFLPIPTSQPNISHLITSLDSASLSQLLGAMSGNNTNPNPQPAPTFNADLARLLAQVSTPAQPQGFNTPAPSQLSHLGQFPGLASLLANQRHTAATQALNTPQPAPTFNTDLARMLAQVSGPAQPEGFNAQAPT